MEQSDYYDGDDDALYLRNLAERIFHIAAMHGVDGGDVDRLCLVARKITDQMDALKKISAYITEREKKMPSVQSGSPRSVARASTLGAVRSIADKAITKYGVK